MTHRHAIATAVLLATTAALPPEARAGTGDNGGDAARLAVVTCLGEMGMTTDWDVCRTQMFEPCATGQVGTSVHVECLRVERDGWMGTMEAARIALDPVLTEQSRTELASLIGQWFGYLGNRCAAVASENPAAGEAAVLGCEISELAGLTTELMACAAGRSVEPYCVLKDR
ncbi:MAG: hypothetical protein AAF761_06300 [Pseudomonadota bacterium]